MARYEWFSQSEGLVEAINERIASGGSVTQAAVDTTVATRIAAQHVVDNAAYAPAQGRPAPGCVGDNTADDTAALTALLAALPAGAVLDLGGLAYRTTSEIAVVKAVTIRNGTINAGNHTAIHLMNTAAGVALGPGLTVTRGSGSGVLDNLAQKATIAAAAQFTMDGVAVNGSAHSTVYLAHGLCNGSRIRNSSLVNSAAAQDSAGVYVAAGGTGNRNIVVSGCTVSGGCADGVLIFDGAQCRVSGCDVSGCAVLPTVSLTGWTSVAGNIYQQRTAPGLPGSTGTATDRADGNTRVVRQAGTLVPENGSTPTTPGAGKWGESGGYLYIDLAGVDPNTQTITSDIISGYGVTFYSTPGGFTAMSQNLVEGNQIHDLDGFGIYMQLSSYANTCVDNKTAFNTLTNVCRKGSQTSNLPYAGIGWAGGLHCLSIGDHIDGVGAAGLPVPGFCASDATVACRGRAIGVSAVNSVAGEGFKIDASEWQYLGCSANNNATCGFKALLNSGRVVTGLQFHECTATGNTLAGLSLDASTGGAGPCSVTIVGGQYYANAQQGIILSAVRNSFVTGTTLHDNGVTSFPQLRWVGACQNCGHDQVTLYHSLAGASFQLAAAQATPYFYGKISIPSNMGAANLGAQYVQIAGGSGTPAVYAGSGAPAMAGVLGDVAHRSDTPSTANQRQYVCTTAGAAGVAVWTGIL